MLGHQLPNRCHPSPTSGRPWTTSSAGSQARSASSSYPELARQTDLDWEAPKAITSWRRGVPLELLRCAGVNRLKVDIDYRAENRRWGSRRVEPYSLRYSQDGNLILFVVNDYGQLRSY
jgi:hypothetical protein